MLQHDNQANPKQADLLLVNGNFHTMDEIQANVSEIAISNGYIIAAGSNLEHLLAPHGNIQDLGGRCVIPGLTDSHIHFSAYAMNLREVDLSRSGTLSEMLELVVQKAHATLPGQWVFGHGWDQELWPEHRFPTNLDLDAVVCDKPVVLWVKSHHAMVVNSMSLQRVGITAEMPDPPGGRIGRNEQGLPNGMLFEGAMNLVHQGIPQSTPTDMENALREAFPHAWRMGLTTIHDMDGVSAFSAYQRLHVRGELGIRVVKYLPADVLESVLGSGMQAGLGDDWLRLGGIKAFADGALGPRTAAMLVPYEDEPENIGLLTVEEGPFRSLVHKAAANGLPLAVHAIGDRANRMVLDALAEVSQYGLRHRIEHVQLLHPDDVCRLAALGIIASMQPIHAIQDSATADRSWGKRSATAYAWKSLLQAGTSLAFGSDSPVESLNPFLGIHAAVTRQRLDGYPGSQGWYPEQRLTVDEAVHGYTLGAAYAVGLENRLGSLTPGKLADLTVLNQDIFTCDPTAIAGTQVQATMIQGQWVYETS